jgi:hypothetical protein
MRETFVGNAPTYLDELDDPDALQFDLDALAGFDRPALLTSGTESARFFSPVVDKVAKPLPRATRVTAPTTCRTSASPSATSSSSTRSSALRARASPASAYCSV